MLHPISGTVAASLVLLAGCGPDTSPVSGPDGGDRGDSGRPDGVVADTSTRVDGGATNLRSSCTAPLSSDLGNKQVLVRGLGVDRSGRISVSGTLDRGPNLNSDVWVASYGADCRRVWEKRQNGTDNSDDVGWGGALAPDDHIFVLGAFGGTEGSKATRYTEAGEIAASATVGEFPRGAAVAPDGTLYVVQTLLSAPAAPLRLTQSKTSGFSVDLAPPDGAKFDNTVPAVATDAAGNVLVSAAAYFSARGTWMLWFARISSTGTVTWTQTQGEFPGGITERPGQGIVADATGDVIATGTEFTKQDRGRWYSRAWARKYSPTGATKWTYVGPEGVGEASNAVAVDAAGNVYLAGSSSVWGFASITKLSPAGAHTWTEPVVTKSPGVGIALRGGPSGALALVVREGASSIEQYTLIRLLMPL